MDGDDKHLSKVVEEEGAEDGSDVRADFCFDRLIGMSCVAVPLPVVGEEISGGGRRIAEGGSLAVEGSKGKALGP